MKKIVLLFGIMAFLLTSGIVLAAPTTPAPAYYIHSESPVLKALFGVNHQFDDVFSTELSSTQLGLVKRLGVKTEPVQIYEIVGRPPCNNDGICDPEENPRIVTTIWVDPDTAEDMKDRSEEMDIYIFNLGINIGNQTYYLYNSGDCHIYNERALNEAGWSFNCVENPPKGWAFSKRFTNYSGGPKVEFTPLTFLESAD